MAVRAPEVTRREVLLLALGSALLAVVMTWPLVLNLGETIPKDVGDPLVQAWQAAWDGHALVSQPLDFFQSNQFWPLPDTLALSDALVGYAPFGVFGEGVEAAVVRYDLLFVFAYALAFAGAYLLARELGLGPGPALVAGAAFAFAPFRLEQDGHMHVISSGGIPLALAVGLRGYRLERPGWVVAGWAVAAWQLTLGWTLGLPLAYVLAALFALFAIAWWRRGRPPLPRRLLVATAVGGLIFAATAAVIARPYLRIADAHPESRRSPAVVEVYSGEPAALITAPAENPIWGPATAGLRDDLSAIAEKTLFPGLVGLALAIAGLGGGVLPRRLAFGLGAAAVLFTVLALGFREEGGLLWPYRVVYELLPGWEAFRVPGRLVTFASLALALLAGAGAARLVRRAPSARPWAAPAIAAALALALVVEGRGLPFDPFDDLAQPRVPDPPVAFAGIEAPQLHLPAERAEDNRRYLLWSTDGFPALVNGRSSTNPVYTRDLLTGVHGFPDAESVELLRREGVRSVVIHPDRVGGTAWQDALDRPIAGLAVEREERGGVVVYEIDPASSAGSRGDPTS